MVLSAIKALEASGKKDVLVLAAAEGQKEALALRFELLDVRDRKAIDAFVGAFPSLDVLVNSAGVRSPRRNMRRCRPGLFGQQDRSARVDAHARASLRPAARLAAPGGHVVFIGIPVDDVSLDNKTFQHFLRQEVSLHGAWNSFSPPFPGKEWTVSLAALGHGTLKWEFMITHELPLRDLPRMFETPCGRNEHFSKVMFRL